MTIYISNESTVVSDDDLLAELPAYHLYEAHIRLYWRTAIQTIKFLPDGQNPPEPDAWLIKVLDDSDQQGALGYHDYTPNGRPISYVFAKTDQQYGYSRTVTLTHELAEMICDPWISTVIQVSDSEAYALEVCDPVEADVFGYSIKTPTGLLVKVSDFVLPYWYQPGEKGMYDRSGQVQAPLEILQDGYAYVLDLNGGGWYALNAQGQKRKPSELPERERLQRYARSRG